MALQQQKIIFFSAIFVVFIAVVVTAGRAHFTPHGNLSISPNKLWDDIENGKVQNRSSYTVEGEISSISHISGWYVIYFKGCSAPFVWAITEDTPENYLGMKVSASVVVVFLGTAGDQYEIGKDGWIGIITAISPA